MSEAPETIWADRKLIYPVCKGYPHATEYRRADLPPTQEQLSADPRVKALVDALKFQTACFDLGCHKSVKETALINSRAALAPFTEAKP